MIFGIDDRLYVPNTVGEPWRYVVRIEIDYPLSSGYTATGVMVGPNDVLTAAHVVYDAQLGGFPTAVRVYPGQNGNVIPLGGSFGETYHVLPEWIARSTDLGFLQGAFDYDIALITLTGELGDTTGYVDPAVLTTPINRLITTAGYPGDRGGLFLFQQQSRVDGADQDTLFFTKTLDLTFGQSGSPIFSNDPASNETVVVGVLTHEGSNQFGPFNGAVYLNQTYAAQVDFWRSSNNETEGPDFIFGGYPSELWIGLGGNDTITAMDGNDTAAGGWGDDDVNGNKGNDLVDGEGGGDFARGGQGNDSVFGSDGDDWHVNGNIGLDFVYGGDGNDTVFGGPDADRLFGGPGSDRLSGDIGNDTLTGDLGADLFILGPGQDVATDFTAEDRIGVTSTPTSVFTSDGTRLELAGSSLTLIGVFQAPLEQFVFL